MKSKTVGDWERKEEKGILPEIPDETMTTDWNRFHLDPLAYIEKKCNYPGISSLIANHGG